MDSWVLLETSVWLVSQLMMTVNFVLFLKLGLFSVDGFACGVEVLKLVVFSMLVMVPMPLWLMNFCLSMMIALLKS